MPAMRRVAVAAEADRRHGERRGRIGSDVKAMRIRRSWTQGQLAERIGVDRLVISRIERGVGRIDPGTLERIGLAFGVPFSLGFARDPQADVADAGHLAIQELVLKCGRRSGYGGEFELATRPAEPWRSVDVVLADEARHRLICVECWNTIGDIGAAVRSSVRKAAELDQIAAGRWGDDAKVGLVWVVRATGRNRTLIARYPEVFAARFRGSSHGWVAALMGGSELPTDSGLVWCDLGATRLFPWRKGPATDT